MGRVEGMGNVAGFEILEAYRERAEELRGQLETARSMEGKLDFTHGIMMAIKTCLPKTSETIGLLERWMIDLAELPPPQQDTSRRDSPFGGPKDMQTTLEEVRGRSVWW
ncbi:MAG: hypothetical protein O6930_05250, partial [Gammaproteobacteria bacterium]|nr:hypothetical protein [Gammaproteobacteria bacterium]